jgi:hypothetical protein
MQTTANKTAAELTAEIQKLINSGETFARVCSVTGRGMWEGHYFEESDQYAYDQQIAEKIAGELGYRDYSEAYHDGTAYWTEWDGDEPEFVEIAGKMYELADLETIAQLIYKNANQ